MKKNWTKKAIDHFVDDVNDGFAMPLLDVFPYTKENKAKIDEAIKDEDNYTDSDVCDLLIELAYEQVGVYNN